jgi:hypothetical protein
VETENFFYPDKLLDLIGKRATGDGEKLEGHGLIASALLCVTDCSHITRRVSDVRAVVVLILSRSLQYPWLVQQAARVLYE